MPRISAVILDVGGTLWPEAYAETDADQAGRACLVAAALGCEAGQAEPLVRLLLRGTAVAADWMTQDTLAYIRRSAAGCNLVLGEAEAAAVCRAMCLPALGRWQPFLGATELLAEIKERGSACAVLSNSTWRDAESYRRDFEDLGLSSSVDAIVTSVETGLRKPNPAIFELALAAIGCPPAECVMIGNSEPNDVLPALALGMRAIRVAIEEPLPASSAAHAIAGSLAEVAEVLRSWQRAGSPV